MSSQMETLSPSTGAITVSTHQLTPGVVYDYDWNFARAFLYSLTVLTTIGEYFFCLLCSIINSRIYSRVSPALSRASHIGFEIWYNFVTKANLTQSHHTSELAIIFERTKVCPPVKSFSNSGNMRWISFICGKIFANSKKGTKRWNKTLNWSINCTKQNFSALMWAFMEFDPNFCRVMRHSAKEQRRGGAHQKYKNLFTLVTLKWFLISLFWFLVHNIHLLSWWGVKRKMCSERRADEIKK